MLMTKEIRCPFRFRLAKRFFCTEKRGCLVRKRVCVRECQECELRRQWDAVQSR